MSVAVGWCKIGRIPAIRCVTWDSRSRTCGGHNSHGTFCVSDLLEKREALFATRLHTRPQRGRVAAYPSMQTCARVCTYIYLHRMLSEVSLLFLCACIHDGMRITVEFGVMVFIQGLQFNLQAQLQARGNNEARNRENFVMLFDRKTSCRKN